MIPRLKVTAHNEPGWNYNLWKSVFHPVTERLGAGYMVYNQRIVPVSFNDDRFEGYWALRRQAIVIDASAEKLVDVRGPDAERLLERAMTRHIAVLKPGRAGYALLCWPHGGLLTDGVLMRLAPDHFQFVSGCGETLAWLTALGLDMDVAVSDPDVSVLAIQGPRALDVLGAAADGGVPAKFSYCAVNEIVMGGQRVTISRTGFTNELGFEVYITRGGDGPALLDHLLATGRSHGLRLVGLDTIDIRRVEGGIMNSGSDFDETTNPFEVGMGAFVAMDKADFVGKSALERGPRARRVFGLLCSEAEPLCWGALYRDGRPGGHVTVGAWSPYLRSGIGIVRLDEAGGEIGMEVEVETRSGRRCVARLAALPLYDPEHAVVRGATEAIPEEPAQA